MCVLYKVENELFVCYTLGHRTQIVCILVGHVNWIKSHDQLFSPYSAFFLFRSIEFRPNNTTNTCFLAIIFRSVTNQISKLTKIPNSMTNKNTKTNHMTNSFSASYHPNQTNNTTNKKSFSCTNLTTNFHTRPTTRPMHPSTETKHKTNTLANCATTFIVHSLIFALNLLANHLTTFVLRILSATYCTDCHH